METVTLAETQLTFGRADDFIVVSTPKKGIAFVEARLKDPVSPTSSGKGCQQILAMLERELSPPKLNEDAVISLEADLLKDTILYKDVPRDIFHSLRVIEFQGLDPSTRTVSARDVAIKINLYGLSTESPTPSDDEMVTVLPNSKLDGLWEFC